MMGRLPLTGGMVFFGTVLLVLLPQGGAYKIGAKRERMLPSFYHTSDELRAEVQRLAGNCESMLTVETKTDGDASIDVITVRKSDAPNRFFLLFGEHARELISPESGLHFLQELCRADRSEKAQKALEVSQIQLVLNANEPVRREVERGDFCKRVNQHGVDLNRNWDEKWAADSSGDDTNSGSHPFSEGETRILRDTVTQFRPTTFLTIHSGTRGMYMPFAFDRVHTAERNAPEMLSVLRGLDTSYCKCPFGAAGKEVGYSCPGTCLDYAYEKLHVPYAYAWEIYGGDEEDLTNRYQTALATSTAFLQKTENGTAPSFLQYGVSRDVPLEGGMCFGMFNPPEEAEYVETVENWTEAYLDLASRVAAML